MTDKQLAKGNILKSNIEFYEGALKDFDTFPGEIEISLDDRADRAHKPIIKLTRDSDSLTRMNIQAKEYSTIRSLIRTEIAAVINKLQLELENL